MEIITKDFHGSSIRVIIINGKEYFVAKDIAELLGYLNTSKAVQDHCKKATNLKKILTDNESLPLDKTTIEPYRKLFGNSWHQTKLIPESDVWRLVIKSRLPEAEKIEQWIMEDVLPSIRKTGSYQIQPENDISELENSLKVTKIASQFLDIFHKKNKLQLLYLDNFVKSETGNSIIEKFGIDLKNQFFLPTELGNFIGKSGMEINQIFANFGFQEKTNGVWKLLESGQEFGSVFQNGSNLQIKWKLSVLESI